MSAVPTHQAYPDFVADLKRRLDHDAAMRVAVGGDFVAVGSLQYQLLQFCGLREDHAVVDIGCGSGRLASQLSRHRQLRYTGTDVVEDLLRFAGRISERPDWRFALTDGTAIPAPDNSADFVCFFSVFTHLPHDQCYAYLVEAARVARPGGRIIISFLEFQVDAHWAMFAPAHAAATHLNQFIEQNVFLTWARRLGLVVERMVSGDVPFIPLAEPVYWDDGRVMRGKGNLGQSVVVLRVPGPAGAAESPAPPAGGSPAVRRLDPVVGTRGHVGPGAFALRLHFDLPRAANVVIRASTRFLARDGYGHLLPTPHLLVADETGSVLAANTGFEHLPASHRQLLLDLGTDPQWIGEDDAVLWLQLPARRYAAIVRDLADGSGLTDLHVFIV